jgi:hypothetical protein
VSVHRTVKSTSVLPCGRAAVKKKAEAQKLLQLLEVLKGSAAFEVVFLESSGSAAFEVALLESSAVSLELCPFPFSQNLAHFAWPSCSGEGWLSALRAHAALLAQMPLMTGQVVRVAPQGVSH